MTIKHHTTSLVGVLACGVSVLGAQAASAQPTPQETVEGLVSSAHGLTWASGEALTDVLLDRVRSDPAAHLPLLLAAIDLDDARASADGRALQRARNAADAILRAGGDAGRVQLATKARQLLHATAREQARLSMRDAELDGSSVQDTEDVRQESQAAGRALLLAGTIVRAFTEAGDSRLVGAVVAVLGDHDVGTRQALHSYLRRTALGNVSVAEELEARWLKPSTSPIRSDSQLTRTVLLIRRAVPPTTPPSTPSSRVKRLLNLPVGVPPAVEDAATLREAVAEPDVHLVALETALGSYDPLNVEGEEQIMRFESAAALLGALNTGGAADLLGEWFVRLDAAARDHAHQSRRGVIRRLRGTALDALGTRAPMLVKEYVVANLARIEPIERGRVYGYLLACCRGDTMVLEGLRRRAADDLGGDSRFATFYGRFKAADPAKQ
jgi:hypothetical protein